MLSNWQRVKPESCRHKAMKLWHATTSEATLPVLKWNKVWKVTWNPDGHSFFVYFWNGRFNWVMIPTLYMVELVWNPHFHSFTNRPFAFCCCFPPFFWPSHILTATKLVQTGAALDGEGFISGSMEPWTPTFFGVAQRTKWAVTSCWPWLCVLWDCIYYRAI